MLPWSGVNEGAALLRAGGAVLLTAFCVRWLDDVVDGEPTGRGFFRARASRGAPGRGGGIAGEAGDLLVERAVYGTLFLALACALDSTRAVTLFLCSYAMGMLGEPVRRLPLGLTSRQESWGALLLALWTGGWALTVASFGALTAIQVADDGADEAEDALRGASNWVRRWGPVEAHLAAFIALLAAAWADSLLTVQVFCATGIVQTITGRHGSGSEWQP